MGAVKAKAQSLIFSICDSASDPASADIVRQEMTECGNVCVCACVCVCARV